MDEIRVSGNVAKPELRFTAEGKPVFTFSVASQRGKDDSKYTAWFRFMLTGPTAEAISKQVEDIKESKRWITATGSLMVDKTTGRVKVTESNGVHYADVTFYLRHVEEYQRKPSDDEVTF
jgi:hypothetical protein